MTSLLSIQDLLKTGVTHAEVRRRVARGDLVRVRRGQYRQRANLSEVDAHRLAIRAVLSCIGPDVVVSHASAAILHGLPVPLAALTNVSVNRARSGHGRVGGGVHLRGAPIDDTEVVHVGGHAVTSKARTVVDLSRTLSFDWSVAAADAALRLGVTSPELDVQLARSHRWPGNERARAVIAFADERAESPGESRSRAIFAQGGVATPTLQYDVEASGVLIGTSDFAWKEAGVLGEFDGLVKYGDLARPGERPSDVLVREKAREDRLREQGWLVVRWTWGDLRDPNALCERINRVLDRHPRSRRAA